MTHAQPTPKRACLMLLVRTCRPVLGPCLAFSLGLNLLLLALPLYAMQLYNRVLPARSEATLLLLSLLVLGLVLALVSLDVVRAWMLIRAANGLESRWRRRIVEVATGPGAAGIGALRDLDTVRAFVSGHAMIALLDVPWAPVYLAVIGLLHPALGALAAGAALAITLVGVLSDRATRAPLAEGAKRGARVGDAVAGLVRERETLAAMGMLGPLRTRLTVAYRDLARLQSAAAHRTALLNGLARGVRLALQVVLLATAALLAIHDVVAGGTIAASSMLASRALAPVEQAVAAWRQLVLAFEALRRLAPLVVDGAAPERRTLMPAPRGALRIEELVAWPAGQPAPTLRGISLDLAPGEVLGVVGPSGTGKSTLARHIVGATRPHAGKVRIDGADVRDWDPEQLGRALGYLPQDHDLLEGTVAENIARFGPIDDARVVEAARAAGAHEPILRLPQAYQTRVGAGALPLPGGVRQQIALARALYGDPALLVLDQPHAHLDEAAERALAATLERLAGEGRTIVLLSHRPALLRLVDRLLVLDEGRTAALLGRRELDRLFVPRLAVTGRPSATLAA